MNKWQIKRFTQFDNEEEYAEIINKDDGECICDLIYKKEDAQLIVCAPELLEIAEKMLSIIKLNRYKTTFPANIGIKDIDDYYKKTKEWKNIIDKAKGD